ncbi:zinc finger MYM-type protein 1-like [Latimeria chalumnae]|uniref:zinc finger MYM-type protein 1-like n=1 Tax=Latimeria chalumnae TaxID=7897 RepID=UPI00313E308D
MGMLVMAQHHLSSTICEEFIKLVADKVQQDIVDELKLAKYFSFSVDSTPDISHTDQMTFTVRYVLNNTTPVERFLKFVPVTSHSGLHLFNVISETLSDELNINLKDYRGQTYDNASNMSGTYSGVQARVLDVNKKAVYIPCMSHSLNLCGVAAAESCTDAITFFGFVQKLYVFFSGSTYRWGLLRDSLKEKTSEDRKRNLFPKRLSDTRWSARADALRSLSCNYESYKSVLQALGADTLQKSDTRAEANSLVETMDRLETAFMTTFWSSILTRINKTSKLLQSETMDLSTAVALLKSLSEFVAVQRNNFEEYHKSAMSLTSTANFQLKRQRRPKHMADDSGEPAVVLTGEEKFKVKTFYVIVDSLISHLNRRIQAYSEINRFCFLTSNVDSNACKESLRNLIEFYSEDLNAEIFEEWVQWLSLLKQLTSEPPMPSQALPTPLQMLTVMNMHNLQTAFPNVFIALRIYLTLPVSNSSGERSFSHLKRIKNALRSSTEQERLNSLTLLSIESETVNSVDFSSLIASFAAAKACRKPI